MVYYPKIRNPIYLKYYLKKIQQVEKSSNLETMIDFTFVQKNLLDFLFLGKGVIYTKQIKSEILALLNTLKKKNPKTILEIGTAGGGTLFLFSQVAHKDAILISIDLPETVYGESYPKWKAHLYNTSVKPTQTLFLIKANSHQTKTLRKIQHILGKNKLDLLFIDGDHSYKGVKQDFQMYAPLVKENGIIVFHDIVKVPDENMNVNKFWNEIKTEFNYKEIVDDWNQGKCGIGIIMKNKRK